MTSITMTVTKKGTRFVVHRDYKYRELRPKANGIQPWRCTARKCTATIYTDSELKGFVDWTTCEAVDGSSLGDGLHNHEATLPQARSQGYKRKRTVKAIKQEPSSGTSADLVQSDLHKEDAPGARHDPPDDDDNHDREDPKLMYHIDTLTGITAFFTPEYLVYLSRATEVSADGWSFPADSRPSGFQRLYTVHVRCDRVYVQAAFLLLPTCSADAYEAAWRIVRTLCPGGRLEPHAAVLDADTAAREGFARAFPEARISVCRYHVARAMYDQIVQLGLREDYEAACDEAARAELSPSSSSSSSSTPPPSSSSSTPPSSWPCHNVGAWLTRFFGLPMLPEARVPTAYLQLVDAAPRYAVPKMVAAALFADHVRATYVYADSACPPWLWAERPTDDDETVAGRGIDGPEQYGRRVREMFREAAQTLPAIVQAIGRHQADTKSRLVAAARYGRWKKKLASHGSVVSKHNAQAWRALSENRLSMVDYLQSVAYLYRD